MVELESSHGSNSYASVTFNDISTSWQQYTATLTATATDTTARLAVKLQVLSNSTLYPICILVNGQRISGYRNGLESLPSGPTMGMPATINWHIGCMLENCRS